MLKPILLSFFCFIQISGFSQNMVPNPSFEALNKASTFWITNHTVFEERIKEWTTPNLGSPDIFSNKLIKKISPLRKGVILDPHQARTGEVMIGIKTYGCASRTQHCKEYIQIKLTEQIERNKSYYIEFWVNPMATSLHVNNIGLVFSDVEIQDNSEYGIHYFDVAINEKSIIKTAPNEWVKISGTVKADDNYDYIIIGNFYTDGETETSSKEESIPYSYYFIDDVLVRPTDAISQSLTDANLSEGSTITLNEIQFENGQDVLLQHSYLQLDELLKILKENKDLQIQVNGHTDDRGEVADNLDLSNRRAERVVNYLIQNGIKKERIKSKGFGEAAPIADNETDEGRKQNRRVEFVVL